MHTITIDCAFSHDKYFLHYMMIVTSMDLISKISKNDLGKSLPKISFQKDKYMMLIDNSMK